MNSKIFEDLQKFDYNTKRLELFRQLNDKKQLEPYPFYLEYSQEMSVNNPLINQKFQNYAANENITKSMHRYYLKKIIRSQFP